MRRRTLETHSKNKHATRVEIRTAAVTVIYYYRDEDVTTIMTTRRRPNLSASVNNCCSPRPVFRRDPNQMSPRTPINGTRFRFTRLHFTVFNRPRNKKRHCPLPFPRTDCVYRRRNRSNVVCADADPRFPHHEAISRK